MANTITNSISLNFRESEKNEKVTSNDLTSLFAFFYSCLVPKRLWAHQKTRENIDGIFSVVFDFDRKPSRF